MIKLTLLRWLEEVGAGFWLSEDAQPEGISDMCWALIGAVPELLELSQNKPSH